MRNCIIWGGHNFSEIFLPSDLPFTSEGICVLPLAVLWLLRECALLLPIQQLSCVCP